MAESISLTGQVPTGQPFASYASFPLYHILSSSISAVLSVENQTAIFLTFPIIISTVLVIVYYLVSGTTGDPAAAGMSMLVLSLLPAFVYYGGYAITRMMAFVGFMFMTYSAIRCNTTNERSYLILFLLFVVYTILVHQVSILQLSVIIFLFYISGALLSEKQYFDRLLAGFILLITATYWLWAAPGFTSTVISIGIAALVDLTGSTGGSAAPAVDSVSSLETPLFELIRNRTYISLSATLLFLGTLYMIEQYKSYRIRVLGVVTLFLIPLFIPSPVMLLAPDQLNIRRYSLYIAPFIAIAIGYGLVYIRSLNSRYTISQVSIYIVFGIFCLLTLLMVTSPTVTYDTSFNNNDRHYFVESEVSGIDHTTSYLPVNSKIQLDSDTGRYFSKYHNRLRQGANQQTDLKDLDTVEAQYTKNILVDSNYFLFRRQKFSDGQLRLGTREGEYISQSAYSNELRTKEFQSNQIFSSGSTEIWHSERAA
jgi:hypothetical protein